MLVREMRAADVAAVSAIRVRGWQAAYVGMVPAGYLDAMSVDADAETRREALARGTSPVRNLVAVDHGRTVAGWAALGPSREADARLDEGELLALYVRPDLLGAGVGRALMEAVLAHAEVLGYGSMVLWVLEGNVRARAFYTAAGFEPDGARTTWEVAGAAVPELRYRRELAA